MVAVKQKGKVIQQATDKQAQFNLAMKHYNSRGVYMLFGRLVSSANISLQLIVVILLWGMPLAPGVMFLAFVSAYYLTDLINGIIHMIMDHHENYSAIYGPLVAHFHLHHQTPVYTRRALPVVYFNESGAKIWLVPYLAGVLLLIHFTLIPIFLLHVLVYVGILSSVAEVSHYLCHSSKSKTVFFLARIGLLLSRKHHASHHSQDNTNYAFLNGASDPLINFIARTFYAGYKTTTDLHFANYTGTSADHR